MDIALQTARSLRHVVNITTVEELREDVRFYEMARRQQTFAQYVHHPTLAAVAGEGMIINNHTRFPIYATDFGDGPPLWAEPFKSPVRNLISIYPDPEGNGVAVHLAAMKRAF